MLKIQVTSSITYTCIYGHGKNKIEPFLKLMQDTLKVWSAVRNIFKTTLAEILHWIKFSLLIN